MHEEAIAQLNKAVELSKDVHLILASLGHAYAVSGKRGEAQKVLDEFKERSKREHVSAYFIALIYVGLGEKDQALQWLDKAYQDREFFIPRLKDDLRLDILRSDPRFQDLVRRVGLPRDQQ